MPNILPRKQKIDPARQRYPEAMAGLLALDKPTDKIDYAGWAAQLKGHVPDLIRMVLDDDLNERYSDDPAVWAPIHALRLLAILGPVEAAEPLLECMASDSDWFEEELPHAYGHIGPAAIPLLSAYLEDPAHDQFARGRASSSLRAIAELHPPAREQIVARLTAYLDRPSAGASAEEEGVNASVISDLADLKAITSYEAIRRAFEQDRVDTQILGLEDVERDFGMRPPLDFSQPPQPRQESGVRLVLKCKVCGREREHIFPKVFCDLGTWEDKKKREKYDPIIIPQRVVCPKCGAVDQYELGGMGRIALLASILAVSKAGTPGLLREDQRVEFITFTTRWGKMHPQEAIERYRQELARHPDDVDLRVGFGNTFRTIGRYDEAEAEYQRAAEIDPQDVDVWGAMAQLAGMRGDIPEAIRLWQKAEAVLPQNDLDALTREDLSQSIREALADLRRGVIPKFGPPKMPVEKGGRLTPLPVTARAASALAPQRKVGRNELCPCGSGKKYKHCHGRKG